MLGPLPATLTLNNRAMRGASTCSRLFVVHAGGILSLRAGASLPHRNMRAVKQLRRWSSEWQGERIQGSFALGRLARIDIGRLRRQCRRPTVDGQCVGYRVPFELPRQKLPPGGGITAASR
eukprot:360194-Chlamydomonas_euryale.AAC.14